MRGVYGPKRNSTAMSCAEKSLRPEDLGDDSNPGAGTLERPGALMSFLNAMSRGWNISLFHYRNHGADYGRVLVGMQVPAEDKKKFDLFLVDVVMPHSLFLEGNVLEGNDAATKDNWLAVGYDGSIRADGPFAAPPVAMESAQAAFERVLKEAGATLPKRDAVDTRIVQETRTGTGHIIRWVKETPGWPEFPATVAAVPGR